MKHIIFSAFEKSRDAWLLFVILVFFVILRLPSLVEPDWYGDEGIYQVIGHALNNGRILYRDIWDNKPPLLYFIYSLVDGDLFSVRSLSLLFGIGAVVALFFLSLKLFTSKKSALISTAFFAFLFAIPNFEGNIANAENFMLFPIILAFYLLTIKSKNKIHLAVFSGLLLSFAFLIKIVAIFDLAAILVVLFFYRYFEEDTLHNIIKKTKTFFPISVLIREFRQELAFLIAFFIPIVITLFYFFVNNALSDFFKATFSQNVGYVGWGNKLIFPLGGLVIKGMMVIITIFVAFLYRMKLGKTGFLIIVWFAFSIFNALFSQRPYGHYLLVLLPSLSLFLGYIFENKKLLRINILLLFFIGIILSINFNLLKNGNLFGKTLSYYYNYANFLLGKKSVISYQSFFDRNTPRDYDLSNFIIGNTKKSDEVFVYTDSAQIYYLANKLPPGRYIVSYHITFYKNAISETKEAVEKAKPKYIITTKEGPEISAFLHSYKLKYSMKDSTIYERKN